MAGKIEIDTERCKGCGLCLTACPKGCIFMSEESNKMGYFPAGTRNEDCTGCAMCALMCPEACIKVYRDSNIPKIEKKQSEHKKERVTMGKKSSLTEEKV
ncbi:MAG: 4Fe-4S dicluster domain-containing protein [Planctomycetota bacterium]|jgi:2-oxoglutarate ferredoxin oxidoreductase subunit delta